MGCPAPSKCVVLGQIALPKSRHRDDKSAVTPRSAQVTRRMRSVWRSPRSMWSAGGWDSAPGAKHACRLDVPHFQGDRIHGWPVGGVLQRFRDAEA
jgi:hypothetical protein